MSSFTLAAARLSGLHALIREYEAQGWETFDVPRWFERSWYQDMWRVRDGN